jgi:hypothetical protein
VPDSDPPKINSTNPIANSSVVGTSTWTLTFDEAVEDLSGNTAPGTCSGTIQLQLTAGGNCYPIIITSSDQKVWTIDPVGELSDGDYRLTLLSTIQDLADN